MLLLWVQGFVLEGGSVGFRVRGFGAKLRDLRERSRVHGLIALRLGGVVALGFGV